MPQFRASLCIIAPRETAGGTTIIGSGREENTSIAWEGSVSTRSISTAYEFVYRHYAMDHVCNDFILRGKRVLLMIAVICSPTGYSVQHATEFVTTSRGKHGRAEWRLLSLLTPSHPRHVRQAHIFPCKTSPMHEEVRTGFVEVRHVSI